MRGLPTTAESEAIATSPDLPQNALIDGGFRPATSVKTFTTPNPATDKPLGKIVAFGSSETILVPK